MYGERNSLSDSPAKTAGKIDFLLDKQDNSNMTNYLSTFFYFRRAQRVPAEKTSKLGLDVILWRTCHFMNIPYSTAIKN
jgi:hypothetical protein